MRDPRSYHFRVFQTSFSYRWDWPAETVFQRKPLPLPSTSEGTRPSQKHNLLPHTYMLMPPRCQTWEESLCQDHLSQTPSTRAQETWAALVVLNQRDLPLDYNILWYPTHSSQTRAGSSISQSETTGCCKAWVTSHLRKGTHNPAFVCSVLLWITNTAAKECVLVQHQAQCSHDLWWNLQVLLKHKSNV